MHHSRLPRSCNITRSESKFTMVKRCCIKLCPNSRATGHSLHRFPKAAKLRKEWVQFIRKETSYFKEPAPQSAATLCSAHFTSECFTNHLMKEFGIPASFILKPDAIPTRAPEKAAKRNLDGDGPGSSCKRRAAINTACPTLDISTSTGSISNDTVATVDNTHQRMPVSKAHHRKLASNGPTTSTANKTPPK